MLTLDTQTISALIVGVFSLSIATWGWLLRRWVIKSDQLHRDVDQLRRDAAVKDERIANLAGAVETLRRTVSDQATLVAQLAAAVDKLWITLEAKGVVTLRPSDEALRAAKRKP